MIIRLFNTVVVAEHQKLLKTFVEVKDLKNDLSSLNFAMLEIQGVQWTSCSGCCSDVSAVGSVKSPTQNAFQHCSFADCLLIGWEAGNNQRCSLTKKAHYSLRQWYKMDTLPVSQVGGIVCLRLSPHLVLKCCECHMDGWKQIQNNKTLYTVQILFLHLILLLVFIC